MNRFSIRLFALLLCAVLLFAAPLQALASSLDTGAGDTTDQSIENNPDLSDAEKQQWQEWANQDATTGTDTGDDQSAMAAELEGVLDETYQLDEQELANLEVNDALPSDVVNILLLGVDNRSEGLMTGRSDAVIICSINMKDGSVKLTSITRDTSVVIPGYKNQNRINVAFKFGSKDGDLAKGAALAMKTVNRNFQMNITKYVLVNIHGLAAIIDSLGGEAAGVDGVLFAYRSVEEKFRGRLTDLRIPYVFISRVIPGENYVSCNYYKSMLSLTQMMIETGHRRIGYLGNAGNPNNTDRCRGYSTVIREAGTQEPISIMVDSIFGVDESAARGFIEKGCDAVLCFNDYMAIGLINHFQAMGRTVPADLSVTGFDDSPLRRVAAPLLVTVRQPTSEMAFLASRWLRDNILNKSNRRLCIEVEGEIVTGESVRARS